MDTAHVLADPSTTREAFYVAMTRGRHANHAYLILDHSPPGRPDVDDLGGDQDQLTAGEVLTAIATNTAAEPSAHEAIRVEQDRAASVATLAAEAETIANHAHHTATAELLVAALGDTPSVQQVIRSDDFPRVVTAVRGLHAAGVDAEEALRVTGGRLQTSRTLTARGLADTLNHASPRPTARAPQHLVAGLIPDATLGLTDTDVLRALRERYALIEQRADALVHNSIAESEPWLRGLGHLRADPQRWRHAVRLVATYRDRWGITSSQPLGPPPDATAPHAHHADHRRAVNALALHHSARGLGNPIPVPAAPVDRSTSPRSL